MEKSLKDLGLKLIKKGKFFGLVDSQGNEILPAEYIAIGDSIAHNGMMVVYDKNVKKRKVDIYSFMSDEDDKTKTESKILRIINRIIKEEVKIR